MIRDSESNSVRTHAETTKELLSRSIERLSGLSQVHDLIRQKFSSDAPLLHEISEYLFDLGGKRIRPALCLLVADALGLDTSTPELVQVAAGIELIHMATLLHDDIIDNAELRRHSQSPRAKFGSSQTLLAGDFLLVRAFSLCAHLDSFIIDATERACIELTEGEILETSLSTSRHRREDALSISRKKTASLFRLSTESAAHLAGAPASVVAAMASFGENLGLAFQTLDDILDVVAPENLLGKTSGTDIREKKPSLVNVLWLESGDPKAQILTVPGEPTGDEVAEALAHLRLSEVIPRAKEIAVQFAAQATDSLAYATEVEAIKSPLALEGLHSLLSYCLERMQ